MRTLIVLTALLAIGFADRPVEAQQSSRGTASISARVIASPDDPIARGAIGVSRNGESDGWTVTTGVRDGQADEYRVRLARRDAGADPLHTAWLPARAGDDVSGATESLIAGPGEWLDLTVEHTES